MSKDDSVLSNGVKLVSELAVVPGTSLLLDGKVTDGVKHAVGGVLARAALGPILGPVALAGLALNSFSKSTTDKGIVEQFKKDKPEAITDAA